MAQNSSSSSKNIGLIITSGDCSDYDGILYLPLYYQEATRRNMNVVFTMNYPGYFEKKSDNNDELITYINRIGKSPRNNLLNIPEINENSTKEAKQEVNNIYNYFDSYKKKENGLGYNYNYEDFRLIQGYRYPDTSIATNFVNYQQIFNYRGYEEADIEALKNLEKYIFSDFYISYPIYIDENNNIKKLREDRSQSNGSKQLPVLDCYQKEKLILTFTTYALVKDMWEWCASQITTEKYKPKIFFVIGGTNKFTPFSAHKIKNENVVYARCINEIIRSKRSIIKDFFNDLNDPQNNNLSVIIENHYGNCYIDGNGSLAWFNDNVAMLLQKPQLDVKTVLMGGVLTDRPVNTLGATPFLNRLSCATMNQLYHTENTRRFFDTFKDKLYFVSNNEINENFNFTGISYESFKNSMKKCGLIDEIDYNTVNKAFDAFYTTRQGDRKPFDVLSALALVYLINSSTSNDFIKKTDPKYTLFFKKDYGITLLDKNTPNTNVNNKIDTILKNYYDNGLGKHQTITGDTHNPFTEGMHWEYRNFFNITKKIKQNVNSTTMSLYTVNCVTLSDCFNYENTPKSGEYKYITNIKESFVNKEYRKTLLQKYETIKARVIEFQTYIRNSSSIPQLYNLVLKIAACQDIIYEFYAPDYKVNNINLYNILLDTGITEFTVTKLNLQTVYKNVSLQLDQKNSTIEDKIESYRTEETGKNLYDDLYEYLLLQPQLSNTLSLLQPQLSNTLSAIKQKDIGEAIHDGWALKTFFDLPTTDENPLRFDLTQFPKRMSQFVPYENLSEEEKAKDIISFCAILYAVGRPSTPPQNLSAGYKKPRKTSLAKLTVKELKEKAKERGDIKGYSKMNKEDLMTALKTRKRKIKNKQNL